jgi:hypothetical protein
MIYDTITPGKYQKVETESSVSKHLHPAMLPGMLKAETPTIGSIDPSSTLIPPSPYVPGHFQI